MRSFGRLVCAVTVAASLSGCASEEDEEAPLPPRPVLSVVAQPKGQGELGFAGTIQPRYQTDRGFQVLGRVTAYNVDLGDLVERGDVLAQLDPSTFILDVRAKQGDLADAQSRLSNTTLAEERTRRLFDQKVATQADIDADRQALEAAAASAEQAEANLAKSKDQLGYTTLTADEDGVVTTKDADVGQTVSAGQKVMTIARTDVREAVVDLPEDVVGSLAADARFSIRLQADPTIEVEGGVREIAPQADALTRTRRVRITLDRIIDEFRLGTTITATPTAVAGDEVLEIPVSALLEGDGGTRVWIVDTQAKTVRTVPVAIAGKDERFARVRDGIEPGTRVVVAGVHSLAEGQAIKVDEGASK